MNTQFVDRNLRLSQLPLLALFLLFLTYVLAGWSLAAYHVIWLLSFFLVSLALGSAWIGSEWLGRILGYMSTVLLIATAVSLFITLTLISSSFLTLGFMPILTMLFGWQEMRFWNYGTGVTSATLACTALLGLGLGEVLNLTVLPGARF